MAVKLFVVQVLNSKLGITLRVLVTSATILMAKRTTQKIYKRSYSSLGREDGCRSDRNT